MDSTTELSAVNGMLATIGEAPVNTLEDTPLVDVALARAALREVTRSLLVDGWAFNTDEKYPLYPEGFAPFEIKIPPNAMVVLPVRQYDYITPRGSRLYDTRAMSFNFQGHPAVPCQVIWSVDFSDLPEVTRQYIAVRSARLFQARTTASELLHAFTTEDERNARWTHQRNNTRIRRKRFLYDSNAVMGIHMNR
jgi:hypothetical protein